MQRFTLTDSRGGVVLTASSRELDPRAECWIDGTPKGWYGGYSMRGDTTERLGHGNFPTKRTRSSKAIELRAVIHAATYDEANAEKRRLSAALGDGEPGALRGEESGTPALTATVERSGEILIERRGPSTFTISIPLEVPDGCLYGDEEVSYLYPEGTGVGLEFPLFGGGGWAEAVSYASDFSTLNTIIGAGSITAGGGSTIEVSTEWYIDGASSMKISAGQSRSSAAYILPRRSSLAGFGGRYVTISGTIHLEQAQPDEDLTSPSNPPRALNVGMENPGDGATPKYNYANSASAPNMPGDHLVSLATLLPNDAPGWFVRAFNGSQTVPVWWDNIEITARDTVIAPLLGSIELDVQNPLKVCQSFDIDNTTGEYYVGQPKTGDIDGWIHRLSPQGELLDSMFLPNAGHLNEIGVERDGDDVWIWYWWPAHANGAVRMRYRAGIRSPGDADVIPLALGAGQPTHYSINGDTVSTRQDQGDRENVFQLYDLAAYKAGTAQPLGEASLPRLSQAYQGHAHDTDHLYMHAGGSTGDPIGLWRFPWGGGEPTVVRTSIIGTERMEAEGVAIRETEEGPRLAVGISSGPLYQRVAHVADIPYSVFDEHPTADPGDAVLRFGTAVDTAVRITNTGNTTAYPEYIAVGDWPGGISISAGGTSAIEYPWPITMAAPLRIDSRGSAWIRDSNVTARLTKRQFSKFAIDPGRTQRPSLTPLQPGDGYVEVHMKPTNI